MNLAVGLRNLARVREVVSVAANYGFGYLIDQLGLDRHLPVMRRRRLPREYAGIAGPRRLRLALAELGPAFMKLGQMLSARGDLLPPAIVAELRGLQDEGPAKPFDEIRGVIESELGRPIEQCFAEIAPVPFASASIGQVHLAKLKDGREVTVKVLRPGVRRVVEDDLQILSDAAYLLHRQVPTLQKYNLPAFARQFADQLENELSYTCEAHNADRLRQIVAGADMKVRVPQVVWELTARQVLTTEVLSGTRVDELTADAAVDRRAAARELARCMLHQVFVEGFFHGDPHQGNVLIAEDGGLILLDFGIVGYLDPRTRRLLAEAVRRVYEEDLDGLVGVMSELGTLGPDTDLGALRSELGRVISRYVVLPRRDFPVGELLTRALRAVWLNNIRISPELSLAAKALLMTEAICCELDPGFDFREVVQPVVEEARARLLAPSAVADRLLRSLEAFFRHLGRLPSRLDAVLALMEHGNLRLRVEEAETEGRWARLSRGLNRLGLSLLAAALLAISAVYLVSANHPAHIGLGVAAMVGGILLGLVVVLAALRPGQL